MGLAEDNDVAVMVDVINAMPRAKKRLATWLLQTSSLAVHSGASAANASTRMIPVHAATGRPRLATRDRTVGASIGMAFKRTGMRMIRVKKIAHADLRDARSRPAGRVLHRHPRPDPRGQGEGRGLPRLDARPPLGGAAQGRRGAMRAARLPGRHRTTISTHSRSRPRAHGIKTAAQARIPSRPSPTWSRSRIPKGTVMEVFKRPTSRSQKFPTKGIVPHKLGHVAFFVKDVKRVTDFYLRRARLPRVRLDGRLLLVPALRRRPSHHQSDADRARTGTSTPRSSCATGATC